MNSIFDFLLDLALDWDNVEDYTKYHYDEPEVLDQVEEEVLSPVAVKRTTEQDDGQTSGELGDVVWSTGRLISNPAQFVAVQAIGSVHRSYDETEKRVRSWLGLELDVA